MTPEQEAHLDSIKNEFSSLVDFKYRKGQREHGGNLFDLTTVELVDMAIEEAIDQVVYLLSVKAKISNLNLT